jgi:hypothetical protein
MKKTFLAAAVLLFVFRRCNVRAADIHPETKEITAFVASFSPGRLMLFNKRKNHTYHYRYKITGETRIAGILSTGALVRVTYYLKKSGGDRFVKIAVRVENIEERIPGGG